ncbi:unnamed protein product [Gongylonema pulchrum]|uniref:Allene-oxide cyclase n=1 Tax=Gongylonema pulchrum TaxID=637853 RepID=A0A183EFJ6_9BILA|nr:unnamed protein product [Gongylonema pulchrum]
MDVTGTNTLKVITEVRGTMIRSASGFCRSANVVSQMVRCASATAAAPPTGKRIKTFEIYRYNPEKPGAKPEMQVSFFQL